MLAKRGLLIIIGTLLVASCATTPLDTLDRQYCQFHASIPSYPIAKQSRNLCQAVVQNGTQLYFQPHSVRVVAPLAANFRSNSSAINTSFRDQLDDIAVIMQDSMKTHALIVGFSDHVGDADHNMQLAKRRAEAVAHFLISQGVSPQQIEVDYVGEITEPLGPEDEKLWAARRVEIILFKGHFVRNKHMI